MQAYPNSYYSASIVHEFNTNSLQSRIDVDVCIIGGGYTGLSTALHLAKNGVTVALLESNKVAFGASGRNGGQVCTGLRKEQDEVESLYGIEEARKLWQLGEDAKALVRSLINDYSIKCDYKPGIAHADHKPGYADSTRDYVAKLNTDYDYSDIVYLAQNEMAEVTGSESYFGGSLDRGAGHLHPLNYALGIAHAAKSHGAKIYENSRVLSYESGESVIVFTENGSVKANKIVLACNAYLDKLEPRLAGKIMPINNFVIATSPLSKEIRSKINPQDIAIADSRYVVNYFRLSADGRLLFGGGENYRVGFPKNIQAFVRKPLSVVYPELGNHPIDYAWGGRVSVTMNRMPHFGTLDNGKVIFAQGYSGQGVAIATLAGQLISELITGDDEGFRTIAKIPIPSFPGGPWLRWPSMVLGMLYYAARDRW